MATLDVIFPQPEVVTLGGQDYQAICFRLRDLARLQQIVGRLAGHPMAGRRAALMAARAACGGDYLGESASCRAYAGLLREAIRLGEDWPPPLGGIEAQRLLATGPGAVLWLEVLLSRTNPGFGLRQAAALLTRITVPEEFVHLQAIAYADHHLDELDRIADPTPRRRRRHNWGREIVEFMKQNPAYTLEEVGDLYLSQWEVLAHKGKREPGTPEGEPARVRDVKQRRRYLMAGRTRPGSNGNGRG